MHCSSGKDDSLEPKFMATTRQVQAIRNSGYHGEISTPCPLLPDSEDAQTLRIADAPLIRDDEQDPVQQHQCFGMYISIFLMSF
jgi:hypothetical protein